MSESLFKEKKEEVKLTEMKVGEAQAVEIKVAEDANEPVEPPQVDEGGAADKAAAAPPKTPATPEPSETPPSLGPRYDILGLVGTGGMGTVWKVHDRELNEDFAIKVLKPELVTDETALKRFQKEANLASELTHANIAAIFGPGEDGAGRPYIIMRYVDGESLADILKREGKLSEERAIDIFNQLCEALSHSHMKGIIHRDIKPSNIIISKTESGADLVQLVDFGIARCVYDEVTKTQALTKAVDVFGSPRYMSPEQLLGQEVSAQSDIYSLGIVMYEMLTGTPPFTAENPVELIVQQIHEKADLSKIPDKLQILISACLYKQASARPASVDSARQLSDLAIGKIAEQLNFDSVSKHLYVFASTAILALTATPRGPSIMTFILFMLSLFIAAPTLNWLLSKHDVLLRNERHMQFAGKVLTYAASLFVLGLIFALTSIANLDYLVGYSVLQSCLIAFSAIYFIVFGLQLNKSTNNYAFLFKLAKPNYEALSKHKVKAAPKPMMAIANCALVSIIAMLFMIPSSLAVLYGFWVDSALIAFNPQFMNTFDLLNKTIAMGLGYSLLASMCSLIFSALGKGNNPVTKAIPSTRTQIAIFIGLLVGSCVGSGVFLNLNASTGIFDYLKTSLANHYTPKKDMNAPVPLPSQPDSYYGAVAMMELPPFNTSSPMQDNESKVLEKVLNSNLDPLLKAQVIAANTQAFPAPTEISKGESQEYYQQRKSLVSAALELLKNAPDRPASLPANIRATEIWIRIAMQQHPAVSKAWSLRMLANAAAKQHDKENLQNAIELIKELKTNNPNDKTLDRALPNGYISYLEQTAASADHYEVERSEK